jgi:tRNA(Ile)-lysidine synthetase-like protein
MKPLKTTLAYPKPGKAGGTMIRSALALLKRAGVELPLTSHILIAASAGSDSTALATLVTKYGRKIVQDNCKITLVHVNHGWRGQASDEDAEFVRTLSGKLGVKCHIVKVSPPDQLVAKDAKKPSWEDFARRQRQAVFTELREKLGPNTWVMTAHHADDLAETLLWRLFTGSAETHGGGIGARLDGQLRPLLRIRKSLLQEFLKQEGLTWREDRTNYEGLLFRKKIEEIFPRAIDHLVEQGLNAQYLESKVTNNARRSVDSEEASLPNLLFRAAGLRPKRDHFKALEHWTQLSKGGQMLQLHGRWTLRREIKRQCQSTTTRWVLEKKEQLLEDD